MQFLGENLVKAARLVKEPRRFRLTATVHQMEQVGLDAVPLVALLSYLVGAVIAFLGSTILRDFGAEFTWSNWSTSPSCASLPCC